MIRILTLSVTALLLLLALATIGNPPISAIAEETQSAEEEIYIPTDLEDSFQALKELLDQETIDQMRSAAEGDMIQYHFGLGMWMRNNWALWGDSHFATWFNERGIHHPDDMSGIILDSFWRHLNGRPIELDAQIEYYQNYWEKLQNR